MGRPSKLALPVGAQLLTPRLPLLLLLLLLADPHATRIAAGQAVGTVSTLAGTSGALGSANGLGTSAKFYYPSGVAMDAAGTVALVVSGLGEGLGWVGCYPRTHISRWAAGWVRDGEPRLISERQVKTLDSTTNESNA